MRHLMDKVRGDGAGSYQKTQKIFETTLAGFMSGGNVPLDLGMTRFTSIEAIQDAAIASKLREVKTLWEEMILQTRHIKSAKLGESSYRAATERLQKLSGTTTKQMNAAVGMIASASNAAAKRIVNIQLFVMFLTVALCIIGWLIISRTIVNPILSVTRMARKIADGDLSGARLAVKSRDEVGQLSTALNRMKDNLNAVIGKVQATSDKVSNATVQLSTTANEIVNGTEVQSSQAAQVATAMESMDRGTAQVEEGVNLTTEAGEALTEIVSSIEEASTMVRQIAVAAEEQSATSEEISSNINDIAEVSNKTSEGVGDISVASTDLNHVAEELKSIVNSFVLLKNSGSGASDGKEDVNGSAQPGPVADEEQLKVV